jgi:hypothetical protein
MLKIKKYKCDLSPTQISKVLLPSARETLQVSERRITPCGFRSTSCCKKETLHHAQGSCKPYRKPCTICYNMLHPIYYCIMKCITFHNSNRNLHTAYKGATILTFFTKWSLPEVFRFLSQFVRLWP